MEVGPGLITSGRRGWPYLPGNTQLRIHPPCSRHPKQLPLAVLGRKPLSSLSQSLLWRDGREGLNLPSLLRGGAAVPWGVWTKGWKEKDIIRELESGVVGGFMDLP